jgi:hypothetical protein
VQDLPKPPLLCSECEQRFSKWERQFSLEVFPKVQADVFDSFEYDDHLLKFAVSLFWRVLVADRTLVIEASPQWTARIDLTLATWRKYLLGLEKTPKGVHHLFVVPGIPSGVPRDAHPKFLHYLLRAVDATALGGSHNLAVYVKLLRCIFYAPVVPAKPSGWHGTRIHAGPGTIVSAHQKLTMIDFGDFLRSRVEMGFAEPLSQKALDQIGKAIRANPERAFNSETHLVHLAAKRLWDPEE